MTVSYTHLDVYKRQIPNSLSQLLDDFTVVLGSSSKAWAVVVEWLSTQLADQYSLSRQAQRLLRHSLKDEDPGILATLHQQLSDTLKMCIRDRSHTKSPPN